mgnify:CR=1 FL=1
MSGVRLVKAGWKPQRSVQTDVCTEVLEGGFGHNAPGVVSREDPRASDPGVCRTKDPPPPFSLYSNHNAFNGINNFNDFDDDDFDDDDDNIDDDNIDDDDIDDDDIDDDNDDDDNIDDDDDDLDDNNRNITGDNGNKGDNDHECLHYNSGDYGRNISASDNDDDDDDNNGGNDGGSYNRHQNNRQWWVNGHPTTLTVV